MVHKCSDLPMLLSGRNSKVELFVPLKNAWCCDILFPQVCLMTLLFHHFLRLVFIHFFIHFSTYVVLYLLNFCFAQFSSAIGEIVAHLAIYDGPQRMLPYLSKFLTLSCSSDSSKMSKSALWRNMCILLIYSGAMS